MTGPGEILRVMHVRPMGMRRVQRSRNTHWIVTTPDGPVVLRRFWNEASRAAVDYELSVIEHLACRGWPVPSSLHEPVEAGGAIWGLFRFLGGRSPLPRSSAGVCDEQRRRGQLIAHLHADLSDLDIGQRPMWLRADEGLLDRPGSTTERVIAQIERCRPDDGRVLRAYHDAAQERFAVLLADAPDPIVIHGDVVPWNIRYEAGELTGILDFDLAHLDLRVAEFALAWRGKHDQVIAGYSDVSPLTEVEDALIAPVFWAWCVASATEEQSEWSVQHLMRTPLPSRLA